MADQADTYTMTLSLSVLEHLGLNLYSSIPAVLSEIVANSWDADAEEVRITIDQNRQRIVIEDDGSGMDRRDINERFLTVGYKKREDGYTRTPKFDRPVMGRKGIGKLSLFAISDVVAVLSVKNGGRNAFMMRTEDIRREMDQGRGEYHPTPIDADKDPLTKGTKIVLTDLRIRADGRTEGALRIRLARRFSIIGPDHQFRVSVNKDEVGATERDYFSKIEYLWSIGQVGDEYEVLCKNAKRKKRLNGVVDEEKGYTVKGWVGTVDEQKSITEDMNVVPIFARGKLIHENILTSVKAAGVFARYLMGDIHAEFVDDDQKEDIATSDRQSLKENDPRFLELVAFGRDHVLPPVGNNWRDWRHEDALDKARENPVINEWYNSLKPDAKKYAKQLFGKIGNFALEDEQDRIELYKHGILAFEKLRLRDLLSEVENIQEPGDLQFAARVFASIDELEGAQYAEIAKGRLDVIKHFVNIVEGEKERVIQRHLFDHLWLLHPSWERASTNARIEEKVTTEFGKVSAKLTPEEQAGRIDIRYRTAAGKNIIIELKKYDVTVKTTELVEQLNKYRQALKKCLRQQFPDEPQAIECIAVLGSRPTDMDPEEVDQSLTAIGARIVTYDTLISSALDSYQDYLEAHRDVRRVADVIRRLEETSPG
jgi:hypothetical protein